MLQLPSTDGWIINRKGLSSGSQGSQSGWEMLAYCSSLAMIVWKGKIGSGGRRGRMHVFEGVAWLDDECVDAISYKCFREVIPPVHEF